MYLQGMQELRQDDTMTLSPLSEVTSTCYTLVSKDFPSHPGLKGQKILSTPTVVMVLPVQAGALLLATAATLGKGGGTIWTLALVTVDIFLRAWRKYSLLIG
jgi:hypothetical protein